MGVLWVGVVVLVERVCVLGSVSVCGCVGPRRVGPRRVGPEGWGPRSVGPEPRKSGAPKGGAPNRPQNCDVSSWCCRPRTDKNPNEPFKNNGVATSASASPVLTTCLMLRSSFLHGRSLLSDLHIRHPCLAVPPAKSLPTEQLTAFLHLDGFLAEHPARWVGRRHTVHRWSRQCIRAFHERVNVHEPQRLQWWWCSFVTLPSRHHA